MTNKWNFELKEGIFGIDIDIEPEILRLQRIAYIAFLQSELERLEKNKFDLELNYAVNDLRTVREEEDGFQFEIFARTGIEENLIHDEAGYKTEKQAEARAKKYIKEFESYFQKYTNNY
jgi:hypothetical protein